MPAEETDIRSGGLGGTGVPPVLSAGHHQPALSGATGVFSAPSPMGEVSASSPTEGATHPTPSRGAAVPAASTTPSPLFSPDEATTRELLDQLTNPDFTLREIAQLHATTLEALSAWLARPDIDARLGAIESITARRTRFMAATLLPHAVTACNYILQEYTEEATNIPVSHNLHAREQRRRARETARKAAGLLLRLARFTPGPTPPRAPSGTPSPAPAGEGGESASRVRASSPSGLPEGGPSPRAGGGPPASSSEISNLKSEIASEFLPISTPPEKPTPCECREGCRPLCSSPALEEENIDTSVPRAFSVAAATLAAPVATFVRPCRGGVDRASPVVFACSPLTPPCDSGGLIAREDDRSSSDPRGPWP